MPEVQRHGFTWEKDLMQNVYGATAEEIAGISYTEKTDLPAEFNRKDGLRVSIKTTGTPNTVCMADCLRIFDAVSDPTPLHVTVVIYKQNDETRLKELKEIVELDLTNAKKELFGDLERDHIQALDGRVKSVPQRRSPTEEEHKAMYTLQEELQKKSGAIYLNIKCNSQQSRLQCSFNKFQKFLTEHPERIIARSSTNEFRGGQIQAAVPGGRRQFNR